MIKLQKNSENEFYITVSELYPADEYRFELRNSTSLKETIFNLTPDIKGTRADKFTLWTTGSLNLDEGFYQYKVFASGSNEIAEYGKVLVEFSETPITEYQTDKEDFVVYKG